MDLTEEEVFELRSESKASFSHLPFALTISPTKQIFENSMLDLRGECLSASKHKKLPSIVNPLTQSGVIYHQSKVNRISSNSHIQNGCDLDTSQTSLSALFNSHVSYMSTSSLLHKTNLIKKPPHKIQSIDPSFNSKLINRQNFKTAITIDILSESDRFSRQSLDPLTSRDLASSRFSSRPTSVKEPLFRAPSNTNLIMHKNSDASNHDAVLTSLENSIKQDTIQVAETPHRNEDMINEQDLSEYDEYLNALYAEEHVNNKSSNLENSSLMGSLVDVKANKLDTINESINELMQMNIRKLHLNKKPDNPKLPNDNSKTMSLASKIKTFQQNKMLAAKSTTPPNNKSKHLSRVSCTNDKNISPAEHDIKKPNCVQKCNSIAFNRIQSCNEKNLKPMNQTRSHSTDKAKLNLDLFNPTSAKPEILNNNNNNKSATVNNLNNNQIVLQKNAKKPGSPKQPSFTNVNRIKSSSFNKLNNASPTRIQSSRIEKNKKISIKNEENTVRSITQTPMSLNENKNAALKSTSGSDTNESETKETINSNTNPETGIKLEINSSSIHLIDRIPSANKSARSISSTVTPTPEPKAQANNNTNSTVNQIDTRRLLSATKIATIDLNALSAEPALANNNCVQPNQPLIYDMFEDYPQPFTSNDLTNSSNLVAPVSKKKKVFYKKNVRTSASNHRPPPAPKEKSKKAKSELIENGSQYELINNESSTKKKLPKSQLDENISFDEDYEEEERPNDQASALDLSQSTINLMHTNDDPNELSVKFKSEFVKAVAEKVDLIYKKYNNLITQQESIIANSTKESIEKQTKNLNEQKNHFSEEMASVINFEDVSSNPELIKQLKQVYALLKQNGVKNTNQDRTETTDTKIDKASNNETLNILNEVDLGKKKFDSIRSNADIREVFTIVNGLSKHNSIGSSNRDAEMTFPPIANRGKAALNSLTQSSKAYKLPAILSDHIDKINTKIVPLSKLVSYFENQTNEELKSEEDANEAINTTKPPLPTFQFDSFKKKTNHMDEKPKYNFSNSLDSTGNESNNSLGYDANSISYHYDVKYRNSDSKSTISFLNESENDFRFKWKRGNLIGKGAFGLVYQAMLSTGQIIAVKQIEMEESDPNKARIAYENVREEVKILRELDHINTVQFIGTMLEGSVVNIFMELIPGGTIESLLKTFGPFEENLFKNFTNQIVEGINYLHSKNVVHRDIKGKNIMLMGNGVIKLIDFGCAKRLKKNQSSNSIKQLLKSLKGTPYWMSPEVIRETGHGSKADIWSTGCTIFEMATGLPPWGELQPIAAIYAIGSGDTSAPELPLQFSSEARDFVSQCLIRNPEQRPSAAELLEHDFLKQNQIEN